MSTTTNYLPLNTDFVSVPDDTRLWPPYYENVKDLLLFAEFKTGIECPRHVELMAVRDMAYLGATDAYSNLLLAIHIKPEDARWVSAVEFTLRKNDIAAVMKTPGESGKGEQLRLVAQRMTMAGDSYLIVRGVEEVPAPVSSKKRKKAKR